MLKGKLFPIFILGAVVVAIFAIASLNFMSKGSKAKEANDNFSSYQKSLIERERDAFDHADDRNEKYKALERLVKSHRDFKINPENQKFDESEIKKISDAYKETIGSMREYFAKEYDAIIRENAVDTTGLSSDGIIKIKSNLEKLLGTIEMEKAVTLNNNYDSYRKTIEPILEKYDEAIRNARKSEKSKISDEVYNPETDVNN